MSLINSTTNQPLTNQPFGCYPYTGTVTYPNAGPAFPSQGIYTNPNPFTNPFYEPVYNSLEKLDYKIDFDFNGKNFTKNLLLDNIKSIRKNKMFFRCSLTNNRMQPYDLIMKMIERKEQFSVKIEVSDILSINYINFRFVEIQNNLNFNETDKCDFSVLKVKFKYDKILTENKKLSVKQLRTDKMKKIISGE